MPNPSPRRSRSRPFCNLHLDSPFRSPLDDASPSFILTTTSTMSANAHFDSALTRDFPSTSKLTREDLEELLASSEGRGSDGGAYFEAFVHSLPEVKAMYDEHAQLIKDNEDRAGG